MGDTERNKQQHIAKIANLEKFLKKYEKINGSKNLIHKKYLNLLMCQSYFDLENDNAAAYYQTKGIGCSIDSRYDYENKEPCM